MNLDNVLVVYKRSLFDLYSNSPDAEVREYIARDHEDIDKIKRSHEVQEQSLSGVLKTLESQGVNYDVLWRGDVKDVKGYDLVIAVGGDGTFLDVSHKVSGVPMLGVNSDPGHSVGYFTCTNEPGFEDVIRNLESVPRTRLERMQLVHNGETLEEHVLNDILFAHTNPASVTRYRLTVDEESKLYKRL